MRLFIEKWPDFVGFVTEMRLFAKIPPFHIEFDEISATLSAESEKPMISQK
jgi:hypothetical protein